MSDQSGPSSSRLPASKRAGASDTRKPGWADGLRKLYDSVVDEPLPDSFDDLLKKLDQADDV